MVGSLNINYVYYSYLNMLKKHQLEDYVVTLRMTSEAAISEIETIDILYIDGNHSEEVSTKDVQLYLPKVRPKVTFGSTILFGKRDKMPSISS